MQKLSTCVLAAAVLGIIFLIFCSESNKAVAQSESDLGRYLGGIGSESVYKFSDGARDCYVIIGGSSRPAISCVR